jgi:two-component system sensor histidine kinase CreC
VSIRCLRGWLTRARRCWRQNITLTCASSLSVEGDPDLLEQALGNLLDNAIDFTPQGGAIELARKSRGRCSFVTDSGSGIPDYALERIFERFYSCRVRTGLKSSGLGWRLFRRWRVCIRARYIAQS